jgi:hypothetical protein
MKPGRSTIVRAKARDTARFGRIDRSQFGTVAIALWLYATEHKTPYRTRVSGPRLFSAGRDVIEDAFMRAYVAPLNADSERREFVREDALPNEILSDLLREWSLPAMTTVWAVLGAEDAEAVRAENQLVLCRPAGDRRLGHEEERCTIESQVPSAVMTASGRTSLGARVERAGG